MSHPGNWHRNPRKMALEIERARTLHDRLWPETRPDPSISVGLLRPRDTMRLGWNQTARCDGCSFLRPFTPPSDVRRCNWLYVLEITRCPCGAKLSALLFRGPRDPATGESRSMGEIVRAPPL